MVLNEIRKNPEISARRLAEAFNITPRAIEKHIANLKSEGMLERIGSKKHGYWKVND